MNLMNFLILWNAGLKSRTSLDVDHLRSKRRGGFVYDFTANAAIFRNILPPSRKSSALRFTRRNICSAKFELPDGCNF